MKKILAFLLCACYNLVREVKIMNARLAFADNYLEIRNVHHFPEEVMRGNPYNTTFDMAVCSGDFAGTASCECDLAAFRRLIGDLRKLYGFSLSHMRLDDLCYGSRVDISIDRAGHMEVSGKIFGRAMEHCLEFTFPADQTALMPFIEELDAILASI